MRRLSRDVGVGVGTGAVILLVTMLLEELPPWARLAISGVVAILAFLVARRYDDGDLRRSLRFGSNMDADDVDLRDVRIKTRADDIHVLDDVRARKDFRVDGLTVEDGEP